MNTHTLFSDDDATRQAIRDLAGGQRERLRWDTRRRILASAMQVKGESTIYSKMGVQILPRMAAAAAVVFLLSSPLLLGTREEIPYPIAASAAAVQPAGLEVTEENGRVVLTWEGGQGSRRVMRATGREQLSDLARLPSEEVRGTRWVDDHPGADSIVYYVVE